ncbi:MAG TPA: hypothetical protein VD969_00325 [Symbiobacteriaceae bacterium]|nr:hypothetical protein [Symbiobacteriaceae bacterium]
MFWTEEKLQRRRDELKRHVARTAEAVAPVRYCEAASVEASAPMIDDSTWPVIRAHERFAGRPDMAIWFRAQVAVPERIGGKRLALRFGSSTALGGHNQLAESLLYLNGRPYHGIDQNHRVIFLPEGLCQGGNSFTMAIQAWSGRHRQFDGGH